MLEAQVGLVYGESAIDKHNPQTSPVTFRNLVRRAEKDLSNDGSELLGDSMLHGDTTSTDEEKMKKFPPRNTPKH